jgi:hypothetical protein
VARLLALAFFFLFFFSGELVGTMTSDDEEWSDELDSRALSSAVSASRRWRYQVFCLLLQWVECWGLFLGLVVGLCWFCGL